MFMEREDISSPECLFTAEAEIDPYSSDQEKEGTKQHEQETRCQKKRCNEDDSISCSKYQGIELVHFLKFKYEGIQPKVDITCASALDILTETFKFIYPSGATSKFYNSFHNLSSVENSWKEICPLLWKKFIIKRHVQWLIDNYCFDYTDMSMDEYYRLDDILSDIQRDMINTKGQNKDSRKSTDDDSIFAAYNLASECQALFYYLICNDNQEEKQLSLTQDRVKNLFYCMASFLRMPVRLDGAFEFSHPNLPGGTRRINLKAKPDGTLYIPVKTTNPNPYPYAVLEVYGPNSKEDSIQSSSTSSDSDNPAECNKNGNTSELEASIAKAFNKLCTSSKIKQGIQGKKHNNDLLYSNKALRSSLKEIIIQASPIDPKIKLAFKISTGQLPLEMYGSLVCQVQALGISPNTDRQSHSLGLFIMNEFVYLEKIVLDSESLLQLVTSGPGRVIGPTVYLAKWCFDLKKPDHRFAFLAFLYWYKESVYLDKISI